MEHFARWVVRHRKAVLAAAVLLLKDRASTFKMGKRHNSATHSMKIRMMASATRDVVRIAFLWLRMPRPPL